MHIPQDLILPQDKVRVLDKSTGAVAIWHITDFKHAHEIEPKRYVLAGVAEAEEPEEVMEEPKKPARSDRRLPPMTMDDLPEDDDID